MVLREQVGHEKEVGQILEVAELSFIWPALLFNNVAESYISAM